MYILPKPNKLKWIVSGIVCILLLSLSSMVKADQFAPGIGILVKEVDNNPTGYASQLVFPNGSLGLTAGVGTLTLAGSGDFLADGSVPMTGALSLGVASTTNGQMLIYNSGAAQPFSLTAAGGAVPAIGWRFPGTAPPVNNSIAVFDTSGYISYPTGFTVDSDGDTVVKSLTVTGTGDLNVGTYAVPIVIAQSAVQVPHTGDTNETTLATLAIPAGIIGANGRLRTTVHFSHTNSANDKTYKMYFGASGSGTGGTLVSSTVATTTAQVRAQHEIANRNATNSQVGAPASLTASFTGSTSALITAAIDTTAATEIVITGQLETGTETLNLESYIVELLR